MTTQIIENNGKPIFALVPYEEYQALLKKADDADDIRAFDEAMARDEESFPLALVDRLLAGESPLKVYREYRGLTQEQLAKAAGITRNYLAALQAGKRTGTIAILKKLATALRVDVDDIT